MRKVYECPLSGRYASPEISFIFSPEFRFVSWRRLWIALAQAQKALGLAITDEQIAEMRAQLHHIDYAKAASFEKTTHHEVMAHIHAFGEICPKARGIIHWGATSCYVTDNGDLMQMHEGLKLLQGKLVHLLRQLSAFAEKQANVPCLSYTHLQPAQPTTVGRRACLWAQDFLDDLKELERALEDFRYLGVKGATGTQASFLFLFDNDASKVKQLDTLVAKEMGFAKLFPLSGQTYTRKQDMRILSLLASFAASAHKFATDMRLLAHLKELEEPFHEKQVGSSAMPYKRNPIHCERICGLARFLISLSENGAYTAATQWLERSLDDSSNRRVAIPEAFLAADALLNLLSSVTANIVTYPKMMEKHLHEELPFMATENILMEAVKRGKERQAVHERLKIHTHAAAKRIKEEGLASDLLEQIAQDKAIGLPLNDIQKLCNVKLFLGRSIDQTHEFLKDELKPVLQKYGQTQASPSKVEL